MNANIRKIDYILDYVPVISTVSNLIKITAKIVLGTISKEPINSFPYFAHLSEKSYVRCITLLIPIIGNVIIALHDTIGSPSNEFETDAAPFASEKEIDLTQQTIINSYKEFESRKNQKASIVTTNAVHSGVFIHPVGINNTSKNCWCISVLQILCTTPLYEYVMNSDSNLQKQFPKLFEFIKTYREKPQSNEQLGAKIKEIRREINKHLGEQFSPYENEEGDAMRFIMELFEYLNLDYHLTGYLETRNEQIKELIIAQIEQCIFINPESLLKKGNLDIEDIFDSTPYEAVAVLRAEPAHYSSQIKAGNGSWYQCNDHKITKKLKTFQSTSVENDHSILIVGYRKNS